jgi:hypothetical protein
MGRPCSFGRNPRTNKCYKRKGRPCKYNRNKETKKCNKKPTFNTLYKKTLRNNRVTYRKLLEPSLTSPSPIANSVPSPLPITNPVPSSPLPITNSVPFSPLPIANPVPSLPIKNSVPLSIKNKPFIQNKLMTPNVIPIQESSLIESTKPVVKTPFDLTPVQPVKNNKLCGLFAGRGEAK